MKIFEASRNLAKLTAQFTAAGLNIADFINAEDETALKAHIASLTTPPAAVDTKENAALKAENTALTQGLTAAGIAFKPADEAKGLQASDVEKATKDHISLKSAELAAQQGTKPVDTKVDVKPGQSKPNTMTLPAWRELDPHARAEFFRKGGRLDTPAGV